MSKGSEKVEKDIIREYVKRWPRFYYAIAQIFGPIWFTGISPKSFLSQHKRPGKKVNLGSGPRVIGENIINVDIYPYKEVEVVSDLTSLPFESDSVALIVCDNVLEHVTEPTKAVREMYRILEPGGMAYISTPFLYPFHSSPSDYHRWTHQGLRHLLREFKIIEIGVRGGAMSGLTIWLCYMSASIFSFGSVRLHTLILNLTLFVFFPIKFIDIILNLFPFSLETASVFYCIVEKQKT